MNHSRLRSVRQEANAMQVILNQTGGETGKIIASVCHMIVELAEAVAEAEKSEGENMRQLNLGEIIKLLESYPVQDDACRFDFGGLVPDLAPDSYRGYYDQLAMGFEASKDYPSPTVADVLKSFKSAVDKEFTGYKGGEFIMTEKTPVWVSNYGECSSTIIVGKCDVKRMFVFKTMTLE